MHRRTHRFKGHFTCLLPELAVKRRSSNKFQVKTSWIAQSLSVSAQVSTTEVKLKISHCFACDLDIYFPVLMVWSHSDRFSHKCYLSTSLLTGRLNLDLMKRVVKCTVWSVARYSAEAYGHKTDKD